MKLYRVTLKGMLCTAGSQTAYGHPWVVADSPDEAVKIVQGYLKEKDYGFDSDRVLDKVEFLAEEGDYPQNGYQLFVKKITPGTASRQAEEQKGEQPC